MDLFSQHLRNPVYSCKPVSFWVHISSSSEESSLTWVFFSGSTAASSSWFNWIPACTVAIKGRRKPWKWGTIVGVCHSGSIISSTGAKIIFPGVIWVHLCLCNHLVSFTFAPLFSGQTGEELQDPNLMFHSSLLPPLVPLSHLPLPALLPLQPLCQELLVPASLILPLILQLHEEAPRVRHQPLEAVR